MNWVEVTVKTVSTAAEFVCDALYGVGISGVSIDDKADVKDFLENNHEFWDYVDDELLVDDGFVYIKAYVADDQYAHDSLISIKDAINALKESDIGLDMGELSIDVKKIDDQDWANAWKQYFKPLFIGESFIIKPSWEACLNSEGKKIIDIDPEMAFGTGQHHTTRMCIELIEKYVKSGMCAADIGCGSGILSIAALMCGAKKAVCIDVDREASDTAARNISKNGFDNSCYFALTGNILKQTDLIEQMIRENNNKKFDILLVNIVADVIIAMSEYFNRLLVPGGLIICSGIIDERKEEVITALYRQNFNLLEEVHSGDWTAYCMKT